MREVVVVAILGAQLTIGGAIVFQGYVTTEGDHSDTIGIPMIFFGVVLGVLAAVRAYRTDRAIADVRVDVDDRESVGSASSR